MCPCPSHQVHGQALGLGGKGQGQWALGLTQPRQSTWWWIFNSHCKGTGHGQVVAIGPITSHRNVNTRPRQGKEWGPVVLVQFPVPVPVLVPYSVKQALGVPYRRPRFRKGPQSRVSMVANCTYSPSKYLPNKSTLFFCSESKNVSWPWTPIICMTLRVISMTLDPLPESGMDLRFVRSLGTDCIHFCMGSDLEQ